LQAVSFQPQHMLISRTPYRFSIYGGGLDYPNWYKNKDCRVLCAGLDYYCYQTIRKLPPFFKHKYRACYSTVETTNSLDCIRHPAIREVFKKYGGDLSLEVTHVGDLPSRSGIGSSSAFTVGLINSITALNGNFLGRTALANAAIKIEQKEMGEQVGFQDQCAAAFGGLIFIEADSQSIRPRKFVSKQDYIDYICSNLLLGFDGVERLSGTSSAKISKNILDREFENILTELALISNYGIEQFGKEVDIDVHAQLTRQCRDLKLRVNGDISSQRNMEIIQATERAGSLCTRTMGAGGGGFFVCWAPHHTHEKIKESVKIKTWVDVRFSNTGSQVIFSE